MMKARVEPCACRPRGPTVPLSTFGGGHVDSWAPDSWAPGPNYHEKLPACCVYIYTFVGEHLPEIIFEQDEKYKF